jgi:hypothetical protein
MNKTKHIAQFESFTQYDFDATKDPKRPGSLNGVICITDYSGTIAVGSLASARDQDYIREIMEKCPDCKVTVLPYETERCFVSYGDDGVFELVGEGDNYKVGNGFVFPMLDSGQFLCVFANGHSIGTELVDAKAVNKMFVG